jgi:exopolysaccharide biosynthesis polyprenyl glycosylphosphotransferase
MSTLSLAGNFTESRSLMNRRTQVRAFLVVLFLGDLLSLVLAFTIAFLVRFESGWGFFDDGGASNEVHVVIAAVLLPIWLLVFTFSELYNTHYLFSSTQEYKKIFNACSIAFTLVVVTTFLVPIVRVSRGWIVIAWVGAISFVTFDRFVLRYAVRYLRAHGQLTSRALMVGTDEEARAIAQQIFSRPTAGVKILGFVDRNLPLGSWVEGDMHIVGSIDDLPDLTKRLDIDELIISPSALQREDVVWIFQTFGYSEDVELRFSPGLFEIFTSGVRVKEIANVSLVSMRRMRLDGIETAVKTMSDYVAASVLLLALSPILLVVGLLIKLDSPGPALHRRRVVGRRGRQFDAFKFRTMQINSDQILGDCPELRAELTANHKSKDDPRVTRVGRFLRKYSIDELPQLINILLGQMSLVGPRMMTLAELEKYGKWRLNLWTVKPGMTGLWQVSGRSDVAYDKRVRLDLYYIRNYSLWFDLQILWRTIPVVLGGKGAY